MVFHKFCSLKVFLMEHVFRKTAMNTYKYYSITHTQHTNLQNDEKKKKLFDKTSLFLQTHSATIFICVGKLMSNIAWTFSGKLNFPLVFFFFSISSSKWNSRFSYTKNVANELFSHSPWFLVTILVWFKCGYCRWCCRCDLYSPMHAKINVLSIFRYQHNLSTRANVQNGVCFLFFPFLFSFIFILYP